MDWKLSKVTQINIFHRQKEQHPISFQPPPEELKTCQKLWMHNSLYVLKLVSLSLHISFSTNLTPSFFSSKPENGNQLYYCKAKNKK